MQPGTDDASVSAFELLAPGVQRALWDMKWRSLRPIQVSAIRAYFGSNEHQLIMAETAGGKTEAAFLPILSAISEEPRGSVRVLYVGPLKALINDQFERLERLCERLDVPVHRWHGDISASQKRRVLKEPGGVLLITPESIESLLINRSPFLSSVFGGLRAVVVDEVHAFLGIDRGLHLASLLNRLRRYVAGDTPRMFGLSATIGDPDAARRYLSPDAPERVSAIEDPAEEKELLMRLHLYKQEQGEIGANSDGKDQLRLSALRRIAADVVDHCYGRTNLVFCNAKGDIELLADACNEVCDGEGLARAFLVHHGSLAKEIREDTEEQLKSGRAWTAVCSSTLEMGIDIGDAHLVGQVGPPWSVSALQQRLGRSGRREGESRRLRLYIIEDADPFAVNSVDRLPLRLLQAVAVCDLMLADRWLEPVRPARGDLSTLTQQIISVIAERGGVRANDLYEVLCQSGPFRSIKEDTFAALLRALGRQDVIEQTRQGDLILGLLGEKIRAGREFYAVFQTPEEFRVMHSNRPLGTFPARLVPPVASQFVFAGRRWVVQDIEFERHEIHVAPAHGRAKPAFLGAPGEVPHEVRERMRLILDEGRDIAFVDADARSCLQQATETARDALLARRGLSATSDTRTQAMFWTGTREMRTIRGMLALHGLDVEDCDVGFAIKEKVDRVRLCAEDIVARPPTAHAVASALRWPPTRKYDHLLPEEMRLAAAAIDEIDVPRAIEVLMAAISS